jgi:hypothetical protein
MDTTPRGAADEQGHDHQALPSDLALRVKSLESLTRREQGKLAAHDAGSESFADIRRI